MENVIKVSIVVPVYNSEKYLDRCLNSIVNQTLKEIEIICVNDGSSDNSVEIIEKFAKDDKRIIILNEVNQGISSARNLGIKYATGEYIAFIDSDDYIDKNFCEALYVAAKKRNADIACAGIVRENAAKKKNLVYFDKEIYTEDIREKFLLTGAPKRCFVWNKIYKRQTMELSGLKFQDGLVYEDMMFTPDAFEKMRGLVTVKDVYYHYWKHSDSLIKIDCDKFRADKLLSHSYLSEKIQKYNLDYAAKWGLVKKIDIKLFGIKILKIYEYRATKKYYLFGILLFLVKKEYV